MIRLISNHRNTILSCYTYVSCRPSLTIEILNNPLGRSPEDTGKIKGCHCKRFDLRHITCTQLQFRRIASFWFDVFSVWLFLRRFGEGQNNHCRKVKVVKVKYNGDNTCLYRFLKEGRRIRLFWEWQSINQLKAQSIEICRWLSNTHHLTYFELSNCSFVMVKHTSVLSLQLTNATEYL